MDCQSAGIEAVDELQWKAGALYDAVVVAEVMTQLANTVVR
jgi:hypothetical protein